MSSLIGGGGPPPGGGRLAAGAGVGLGGGRQFAKGHDCVMVLAFSEREYTLGK